MPRKPNKYLNHNFFKNIDDEYKAYVLGFLYADGYMTSDRYMSIAIDLAEKDKSHLVKILNCMYEEGKYNNLVYRKKEKSCKALISSKIMFEDLKKLGLTQKKTFCIKFPNFSIVPSNLIRHFIRGYFDGDGTVGIYKDREFFRRQFSIVGNYEFMEAFKDFLIFELNLKKRNLIKDGNIYKITFSAVNDLVKIYDYLYKESAIFMVRKKEMFDRVVENCKNSDRFGKKKYSNYVGVSFDKAKNRWIAYFCNKNLGYFLTEQEAYAARLKAENNEKIGNN